jgi:Zn-dependent protease with chaperone function
MFDSSRNLFVVVVLVALLPGVISWWFGRRLARNTADPALPEVLAGHRRRNSVLFAFAMVACGWMTISSGDRIALPLILGGVVAYAGLIAAAYPLRRALYHETWSFFSYCAFYPRTMLGVFGFWLAVASFPGLASLAGNRDWIVGSALAAVLVLWNSRYADMLRWCLRTQPLGEGALLSDCRALAVKSGLPQMHFERIVLNGGVIANAMALPSLRGSSVLFTDTILERFDRQELLAVCAHELAHFDHYNPKYLRQLRVVNYGLIAAGVTAAPLARTLDGGWGVLPGMLWLCAVVGALAIRARGKQRQETMCDLRAVELTGDGEALVRGLTKLYTIARLPRRLDSQTEQSATHPSLARRIRDIRKAAGSTPAPLSDAHTFAGTDGRSTVTFDDTGLRWIDRNGVTYALSYSQLTELRVVAKPGRSTHLVAVGPAAQRWELALRDADIARIQAVLDTIDHRLADPPRTRPFQFPASMQRLIVLTTAMIGLSFSQLGMAVVALLAWARPTVPMLVGAGVAAFTTAALMVRDLGAEGYLIELSLPVAILGCVFFALAWSARHKPREGVRLYVGLLALVVLCSLVMIANYGLDIVGLHRGARAVPSATVVSVALAAALLCFPGRRERIAGAITAVAALALVIVASTSFLDRFAADPFLVRTAPLRWTALDADPIQAFDVPYYTSRIELTPNGEYVAIYAADDGRYRASKIQIGRVGEPLTSIAADDVAFVNDDNVLIVQSDSRGTTLRMEKLHATKDVIWQRVIENVSAAALSVDRATGRWALLGWAGEDAILRVEGALDDNTIVERRWPVAQGRDGYIAAMTATGPLALVLETKYERGVLARAVPWRWTWAQLLLPTRVTSRYTVLAEHGRQTSENSKLDLNCAAGVMPGALTCTAYDGSRTQVMIISSSTAQVEGIGFIEGHFVADPIAVRGWLNGWVAGRPVAIHLGARAVFEMPRTARILRLLPLAGDRLAALMVAGRGVAVNVYAPLSNVRQPMKPLAQSRAYSIYR